MNFERHQYHGKALHPGALAAAVVLATLLPLWAGSAFAADPYYKGKEIEVVVPFAPGGAAEVGARFLQPFLEKHIPGNPRVIVNTRPGGASILGANWFAQNAKRDGTTILHTTSSTAHPYMLEYPQVKYDLTKMRVGYSLSFGPVMYISPKMGVKAAADLKNAKGLVYGGIGAAASDLPTLLSFEVLKLDVKAVLGFTGRGPIRLAFDRGETNFDFQFTPVYLTQVRPMVDAGKAIPLMSGGALDSKGMMTQRDPVVPNLPSVYEVHKAMYGKEPSGLAWQAYNKSAALTFPFGLTGYMHPDTPQAALDALDAAAVAMNADPEFIEKGKKVTGGYKLIRGKDAEPPIRAALARGGPVNEYIKKLLVEKYKVKL